VGLIPDVIGVFNWYTPFNCTMVLGSIQSLK
jgi:hypothetical protein